MTKLSTWNGIVLEGQSISKEDAARVILRTTNLRGLNITDPLWKEKVFGMFGIPMNWDTDPLDPDLDPFFEEAVEKYGLLADSSGFSRLEFFSNWKIFSDSKWGAHGWVDWDGQVFCNSWDIGKYPTEDLIQEEWELISSCFPFLDLTFLVYSGPLFEYSFPFYKYRVSEGKVIREESLEFEVKPTRLQDISKGVDLQYLEWAIQQCLKE